MYKKANRKVVVIIGGGLLQAIEQQSGKRQSIRAFCTSRLYITTATTSFPLKSLESGRDAERESSSKIAEDKQC